MTTHPPECPVAPDRIIMRNEWRELTFLHWAYDVDVVQAQLPAGLEVDPWDGQAWVGVVPFRMHVRTRRGPYVPWISHFPETNVRTYVRGPNGEVGVYFFSLDAARLAAVLVGRFGYGVAYSWAAMSIDHAADETRYRSSRIGSSHSAYLDAHVRHGEPIKPDDVTPFEHYLTARWSLFGTKGDRITFARASHERWGLRKAEVVTVATSLHEPAGLPAPDGTPIAHSSPGVSVDIGSREFLS